jgi:hypothetical protein
MKQEINKLFNKFTNDNLSLYQRENGKTEDSSRARLMNCMLNALSFQLSSQRLYIADQSGILRDLMDKEGSSGEFVQGKIQNKIEYMGNLDITFEEMTLLQNHLKDSYLKLTGKEFKPYAKKSQNNKNVTASNLKAKELLDKYS